ncbi:MAG: hypothetical protein KC635_09200 [Myxococcales bacterium]|nr:hypothetical protein [Myxococcales bacterium]
MVVRSQVQAKTKPEKSGGGGEEKQATTASAPLRGMEFAAATSWLEPGAAESRTAPPPEPTAPVQAKLTGALPKPSLKSRIMKSTYTKVVALYDKVQKAKSKDEPSLLAQLQKALGEWLDHKDEDDDRRPAVKALLDEVSLKLNGPPQPTSTPTTTAPTSTSTPPTTTTPTTPTTTPTPKLVAPPLLTTPTPTPTTPTPTTPTTTTAPTSTTPTTSESTTSPTPTTPTPTSPTTESTTTPTTPTPTTPETTTTPTTTTAPESTTTPTTTETPTTPTTPEPAWKTDPSIVLPAAEIAKLSYDDAILYLDSRPSSVVQSLGKDNVFVGYIIGFDTDKCAQLAVRVILRTPDSVVEKGASRAEAIRILTSQLADKGVIRRLLANEARVIIVPKTMLMTDLPEFAKQKGTYTFDGRPWDVVRGLGGKNTAITEENLLGVGELDKSISRKGWKNQNAMDTAIKNGTTKANEAGKAGPTDADAVVNNPGVYCEGYSTTNHEFFHTIHNFGLSAVDNKTIQSEYDKKKKLPRATHWADGPRLMKDGKTDSENYSSSTVYEYWAQTGCAFQGTNTGTDPYTSNKRNNGRSWVTTNEPGLAAILSKVCSSTELKNVNPRAARKKQEEEEKKKATPTPTPSGTTAPTTAPTGGTTPTPTPPTGGTTAPTKTPPVPPTGSGVIGLVQDK